MNKKVLVRIGAIIGIVFLGFFGIKYLFHSTETPHGTIRIGVLKHESTLPIYVADELGFFVKHNVNVELIELPPGDHMPALLSDRVDILSPTSFPMLFGVMLQHPKLLYAVFPGAEIVDGPTVYGFVVRKDFSGNDIQDLTKRVVMAINPYTQVNVRTILTSAGIPLKEWPEIRVARRELALAAVAKGDATAAIMDQPAIAVALTSGDFKLLVSNPRAKYIGSPYWSGAGAVKRTTWQEKSHDLKRLMYAVWRQLLFPFNDSYFYPSWTVSFLTNKPLDSAPYRGQDCGRYESLTFRLLACSAR